MPQSHVATFAFTVEAVVLMGRTAHGNLFSRPSAADRAIAARALERFGIAHLSERPYTMISGGERQLVLLARALAQEPQFIVLDEPTASLDFGNQGKVMREIRALAAAGHGVLFTTHDPNHAHARGRPRVPVARGRPDRRRCDRRGAQPRAARSALRRAGRDDHRQRRARPRFCRDKRNWNGQDQSDERRRGRRAGERACAGVHRARAATRSSSAFNTVGAHKERFVGGEKTDVIILSFPAIEALEKEGRFAAGSRADLGRASCGVAVRDGMMMPNIATVEGFKRMLHNAGSIAANDPAHGGSSGIYLADLLKRMGLYDEVKPKLLLCKTGRDCALALLRGDAEIGITFTSEFIAVPGHARGRHVSGRDRLCERLCRRDPEGRRGGAGAGVSGIPRQPVVQGALQVVRVGVGPVSG